MPNASYSHVFEDEASNVFRLNFNRKSSLKSLSEKSEDLSRSFNNVKKELSVNKRVSIAQWAQKEVETHKLENFVKKGQSLSSNDFFKGLDKKEKNAIRYQLRKLSSNKSANKSKIINSPVEMTKSEAKTSLIVTYAVEVGIIYLTHETLNAWGLNLAMAILFAVACEFYLMFWIKKPLLKDKRVAKLLLFCSCILTANSWYLKDEGVNRYLASDKSEISRLERSFEYENKKFQHLMSQAAINLDKDRVMTKFEKVTNSLKGLQTVKDQLKIDTDKQLIKVNISELKLTEAKRASINKTRLSLEAMTNVQFSTVLMAILFILIQYFTARTFETSIPVLKREVK